jgi:integrase/recombinase XerD
VRPRLEATRADIQALRSSAGTALAPRTARAINLAVGERAEGPVFLAASVRLRDVQESASHADPRTTMRYDRDRTSLDRHATYIVAACGAGAAR